MALASLPTRAQSLRTTPHLVRAALWLNVLCVVEPVVALGWQWLLARSTGAMLAPHHWLLLGSSTWLVYAADRWLDARSAPRPSTARHQFFAQFRWPLAWCWIGTLIGSVALAVATLDAVEWMLGSALLGLVAAYLLAVHRFALPASLKKSAVTIIYTLGVGSFCWPRTEDATWLGLLQLALALLAGSNLAAVAVFERQSDARGRLRLGVVCASLCALLLASSLASNDDPARLLAGIAGAELALAALLFLPRRLDAELAHALCDVVLLVPLLSWS